MRHGEKASKLFGFYFVPLHFPDLQKTHICFCFFFFIGRLGFGAVVFIAPFFLGVDSLPLDFEIRVESGKHLSDGVVMLLFSKALYRKQNFLSSFIEKETIIPRFLPGFRKLCSFYSK